MGASEFSERSQRSPRAWRGRLSGALGDRCSLAAHGLAANRTSEAASACLGAGRSGERRAGGDGDPDNFHQGLIKEYPNRESLEKLTDAELLRMAAREVAMALIIIARATQAPAMSLGGVADLLKSVGTALEAVGSAFVQALTLRRGG